LAAFVDDVSVTTTDDERASYSEINICVANAAELAVENTRCLKCGSRIVAKTYS
jgi:hypothetical protein